MQDCRESFKPIDLSRATDKAWKLSRSLFNLNVWEILNFEGDRQLFPPNRTRRQAELSPRFTRKSKWCKTSVPSSNTAAGTVAYTEVVYEQTLITTFYWFNLIQGWRASFYQPVATCWKSLKAASNISPRGVKHTNSSHHLKITDFTVHLIYPGDKVQPLLLLFPQRDI